MKWLLILMSSKAIDLTIRDVFVALEQNNQNTGGAYIEKNQMANFIRGEGLACSIEDFEDIVVKTVEGIPIRIKMWRMYNSAQP